jgi:AraC-like DNA-binding protein
MHNHLIVQIVSFLRNNCEKKITSDLIEETFNKNFDYLNRRFKSETGQTIFQFLKNYRIEESKIMLKAHFYTNAQIAENAGFCNEFYFSSVFKSCTGITPIDYKNLL